MYKCFKPGWQKWQTQQTQITLILFTTQALDPLSEQLSQYGHYVFEALAISKVMALAETYARGAPIIIKADIDPTKAAIIQQHYPTLRLKPNATVKDILWELNHHLNRR